MKFRAKRLGHEEEFRGLGLTSRKNLCLHPEVMREKSGAVVDARCRSLTAGFVKEKKERGEDVPVCIYHDVLFLQYSKRTLLSEARILIFWNRITSFQTVCGLLVASRNTAKNTNNALTLRRGAWYVNTGLNENLQLTCLDVLLQRHHLFISLPA